MSATTSKINYSTLKVKHVAAGKGHKAHVVIKCADKVLDRIPTQPLKDRFLKSQEVKIAYVLGASHATSVKAVRQDARRLLGL